MTLRSAYKTLRQFAGTCWSSGIYDALLFLLSRRDTRQRLFDRWIARIKSKLEKNDPLRFVLVNKSFDYNLSTIDCHPLWHLDKPTAADVNSRRNTIDIKGWISAVGTIDNIRLARQDSAEHTELQFAARPDVEAMFGLNAIGFSGTLDMNTSHSSTQFVVFSNRGQEYRIVIPTRFNTMSVDEKRLQKRRALIPRLQCPNCQSTAIASALSGAIFANALNTCDDRRFACPDCRSAFHHSSGHINFLDEAMIRQFHIGATDNISANEYDCVANNLINVFKEGLILDCGAGKRGVVHENVVNYDIVDYDSTDIVGVAEKIPFQSDTFDAVFSFSVLEHVFDPLSVVKEMIRVLKPGGQIYCQVAFLSPLHGYPRHYFNMTQQGIERLFGELVSIQKLEVLNFGQPVFCLSWFLNSYISGLPADLRAGFADLKVADLLKSGDAYFGAPFVTMLSKKQQTELSCCNMLMGRKTAVPASLKCK
ncbi:MAG: class I SAM-dependent methyltransferase [Kiritimatiellae bacterium]|nr:class I SAM-dependent methyltransferase [Kiritimatiellia bacterium]